MKFLFLFFLGFLLSFQDTHSQVLDSEINKSQQENYDYFSLKQKRQNTAAWICLIGGTGLVVGGIVSGAAGLLEFNSEKANAGGDMIAPGCLIAGASIPLFIIASSNGKKARMSLKSESITFNNFSSKNTSHLSFALTIDF